MHFEGKLDSVFYFLTLQRATYEMVQAALKWWQQFIAMLLEEFSSKKNPLDASILVWLDMIGTVILHICIDNILICRDVQAVDKTVTQLQSKALLKEVGNFFNMLDA